MDYSTQMTTFAVYELYLSTAHLMISNTQRWQEKDNLKTHPVMSEANYSAFCSTMYCSTFCNICQPESFQF